MNLEQTDSATAAGGGMRSLSNGMKYSRLWAAATIIAIVIVGGFALSVPRAGDAAKEEASEGIAERVPDVSLRDAYRKGVHTITGSLKAANACSSASAEASADAGGISVAVSLLEDSGICLQVPTTVDFKTTVTAPANLPITATVNGKTATTTIL